jgi:hypothetical protein
MPPLRLHLDCHDAKTVGDYRRLADMGADVVKIDSREPADATLDQRIEMIERFAESIISKL